MNIDLFSKIVSAAQLTNTYPVDKIEYIFGNSPLLKIYFRDITLHINFSFDENDWWLDKYYWYDELLGSEDTRYKERRIKKIIEDY